MKILSLAVTPVLVALLASPTAAADTAGLKRCANIGSPLDRLECYDALARSVDAVPPEPPRAPTVATPAKAPTPPPVMPAAKEPAPVANEPDPPKDFGFEGDRINQTPDAQTARYDGEFSGWSGQTLFRLDNGQVWRQAQSGRVSYRRSRPLITIKKGAFGSYRLSVEGLNKTIRVKRVK